MLSGRFSTKADLRKSVPKSSSACLSRRRFFCKERLQERNDRCWAWAYKEEHDSEANHGNDNNGTNDASRDSTSIGGCSCP